MIAAASLLFPTNVIFTRRRQRTRRRRRRRRSSSSSPPIGRRSHQHLVGLVDVLIGLRDADDASHGGCRQRERPTQRKMSLGLGKASSSFLWWCWMLEQFFFVWFFLCRFCDEPFFFWCGEKKVHTLKGQGAHFLNCFLLVHIAFFPSSSSII